MPALSPTMTEGNIATWRVKEGDSFTAGDVILEIETDKATMDVEAQDDGKLFKIMQGDGAKGVKVGERIAVMAEEGDDLSSLEVPAEDQSAVKGQEAKKEESAPQAEKAASSAEPEKSSQSQPSESTSSSKPAAKPDATGQGGKAQMQTYPLYPSVQQLLHENGLPSSEADKIPASGPKGRLLKGDVLAYLGQIPKEYPAQASARLEKLSHLDLSNIQILDKKPPPPQPAAKEAVAEPALPTETEVALPISLSAVIATQKRVQDALGIWLPLSTFIARASELANEDLPARKHTKPTADDLFKSVLGLDSIPKSSRGHFIPQVTGLTQPPALVAPVKKKADIIDFLAPKAAKARVVPVVPAAVGISATGPNLFSVTAKPGDEIRATEYLERMKLALEKEPGRLVL